MTGVFGTTIEVIAIGRTGRLAGPVALRGLTIGGCRGCSVSSSLLAGLGEIFRRSIVVFELVTNCQRMTVWRNVYRGLSPTRPVQVQTMKIPGTQGTAKTNRFRYRKPTSPRSLSNWSH